MSEALIDLAEIAASLADAERADKLRLLCADTYANGHKGGPYDWQVEFCNATAQNKELALIAANQVGKSRTAAILAAISLTGLYPTWWEGRRWDGPIEVVAASVSNEMTRDICQSALLGPMTPGMRQPSGEGWIPADRIVMESVTFRQCGIANVIESVKIRHASGGYSDLIFKSFEQEHHKFQGVQKDLIWLDEEKDDRTIEIYSECQTRLLARQGLVVFTRTPLIGASRIIEHFLQGGPGIYYKNVTWDDAPHLSPEEKQRLILSYPEHERDTRTKGIPMMGTGGVYPISDDEIMCDSVEIPPHFRRLCAIDFGMDHPAAAIWQAYDPDTDTVYIYDCYKARGQTAAYHAAAIKKRGEWIPVAWPHDGEQKDKGSGKALAEQFREHGVNMLGQSARYDDRKGGSQPVEPATQEIYERMKTGRYKVFKTPALGEWLEEKRMYHRKDGKIVDKKDDLMSASRIGMMSLRFALSDIEGKTVHRHETAPEYDPLAGYIGSAA